MSKPFKIIPKSTTIDGDKYVRLIDLELFVNHMSSSANITMDNCNNNQAVNVPFRSGFNLSIEIFNKFCNQIKGMPDFNK